MAKSVLQFELAPGEGRRRLDHAVKSGHPYWLWPEIAVADWRAAVCSIERIASDVLVHGRSSATLDHDAAVLSVAALTSGMGPLLGYWLREGRFATSADVSEVLALHFRHNERRMEKLAANAIQVVDHLARKGIEATVLKGMHTAFAHFPAPGARPMTDVDLLVAPAEEPAVAAALGELGFCHSGKPAYPERSWVIAGRPAEPRSFFLVHEDDPWSIDLHLTIDLNATSVAPPVKLDSTLRPGAARWALSSAARPLEHPALLMHLAVHAGIHLTSLTLLRLTELALVIRQDSERGLLSWDELHAAASRSGALGPLFPALSLCERLAPGTVPAAIIQACRASAPEAVVRLIESLAPATAQGMLRCSVEERFMWLPSRTAIARQVLYDLLPLRRNVREVVQIYRMLAWRALRRTVTR